MQVFHVLDHVQTLHNANVNYSFSIALDESQRAFIVGRRRDVPAASV